jgi:hypothetical protein
MSILKQCFPEFCEVHAPYFCFYISKFAAAVPTRNCAVILLCFETCVLLKLITQSGVNQSLQQNTTTRKKQNSCDSRQNNLFPQYRE